MSKESHSVDLLKNDIKKAKWVILGIALFYFLLMQVSYSTCPFIMFTGIPCPFCGMTRAGISILKGEFLLAFQLNPMIYGVIFLCFAFITVRYFTKKSLKTLLPLVAVFFIITFVVYIYRMQTLFPDHYPMLYFKDNFISRVLNLF